jgi:hypothetical protein
VISGGVFKPAYFLFARLLVALRMLYCLYTLIVRHKTTLYLLYIQIVS